MKRKNFPGRKLLRKYEVACRMNDGATEETILEQIKNLPRAKNGSLPSERDEVFGKLGL